MKRLIFAAALAMLPLGASAWDAAGHMLVGQIAWEHTKPAARATSDLGGIAVAIISAKFVLVATTA